MVLENNRCVSSVDLKITVVIPLYNGEAWINRAIGSVLAQTYQSFEIIVIDDGSTDAGNGNVRTIADSRIRLLKQANAGVSASRNRGIIEATTEWIAFLDADDEWFPDHLSGLMNLRSACPDCDVLASRYVIRTGDGPDRPILLRGLPAGYMEGVIDNYFSLASQSDPPVWSSAVAVKKAAIESIGGFPVGVGQGEDLLTWARLAAKFRLAYSTKSSAVFWQPAFLRGRPTRRPEIPDQVGEQLALLEAEVDPVTRPSLRRYRGLWHKMRGTMFLRLKEPKLARAELFKSWRCARLSFRLTSYVLLTFLPASLSTPMTLIISQLNRARRRLMLRRAATSH